ncbi:MAG TPA: metallophosphoesterase [Geomonas sp.]|nr:metallophosphoesterase [Geomonas sp.]
MPVFLFFYFAIYGGAHGYLLFRTVRSFHLSAPWPALLAAVSLFMVAAPILVRLLERAALEFPARVVGYLGYLWMGFFFLFLSATIAFDLLRFVLFLAGRLLQRDLGFSDPVLLFAAMSLAAAALLYGLFEARHLRVEQVVLHSPKIPKAAGRVRIVQISDVHLGLMVGKEQLDKMLRQVSLLKPDLLVSTGDLVDGQMDGLKGLDDLLATVKPPLGKFAVLGNHEVFAGVAPSTTFTERGGFKLLREGAVEVSDWLTVAGVDDPAAMRGKTAVSDLSVLAALPRERYTILLKHRPGLEKGALGLFDLQLSGHVHKGQIFPFNLITHLAYPVKMGLSQTGGGSLLYVSRGTGTWGPPARVLAPPEITVIDLLPS